MYKVYRVHRDNNGNIFHKVPVGCAKTEHGAKALIAGQWGRMYRRKNRIAETPSGASPGAALPGLMMAGQKSSGSI